MGLITKSDGSVVFRSGSNPSNVKDRPATQQEIDKQNNNIIRTQVTDVNGNKVTRILNKNTMTSETIDTTAPNETFTFVNKDGVKITRDVRYLNTSTTQRQLKNAGYKNNVKTLTNTPFEGPVRTELVNQFLNENTLVKREPNLLFERSQVVQRQLRDISSGEYDTSRTINALNERNIIRPSVAIKELNDFGVRNPDERKKNNVISNIKDFKSRTTDAFLEKAESNILNFNTLNIQERDKKVKEEGEYKFNDFVSIESKNAFGGLATGGLMLANIPLRPIKTTKEVFNQIINPLDTIKSIYGEFKVNPIGTSTSFYVAGKGLRESVKVIKRVPAVEYVRRERFIRKQPLDIQPIVRDILESEKSQRGIVPVSINSIKTLDFSDVQNLNKLESKAIELAIREKKAVVFGSKSARVLSGGETRLPKDVDLAVKDVKDFKDAFVKNIPKSSVNSINIRNQKIIRNLDSSTIADVKPLDRLRPDKSLLTQKGSLPVGGYSKKLTFFNKDKFSPSFESKITSGIFDIPTQYNKKVKGIKFTSFSEQTSRKALGSLQFIIEKNVRRAKDLPDYIEYLKIQKESLLKDKKNILKNKSRIKEFNKLIKGVKNKSKKLNIIPSTTEKEYYLPSKLPSRISSYLPSKLGNIRISSLSGIPSRTPSVVPSKLNVSSLSGIPSRTPSVVPSRLKINKTNYNIKEITFNSKSDDGVKKFKLKKVKVKSNRFYTPTILGLQLIRKTDKFNHFRQFSGLEVRPR